MSQAIVRSSKEVKGSTSTVRAHLNAVERARDLYLSQMKRAEADYFERIKRATDMLTGDGDELIDAGQPQPSEEQPQAAEPTQ